MKKPLEQTDSLETMISLLIRLGQIMSEETTLLKQMKISETAKFIDEKNEITFRLETMKRHIAANPRVAANFSERDKDKFNKVADIFSQIAAENYKELKVAKMINNKIVEFIGQYAAKNVDKVNGYNKRGASAVVLGDKSKYVPALSVNNVI